MILLSVCFECPGLTYRNIVYLENCMLRRPVTFLKVTNIARQEKFIWTTKGFKIDVSCIYVNTPKTFKWFYLVWLRGKVIWVYSLSRVCVVCMYMYHSCALLHMGRELYNCRAPPLILVFQWYRVFLFFIVNCIYFQFA